MRTLNPSNFYTLFSWHSLVSGKSQRKQRKKKKCISKQFVRFNDVLLLISLLKSFSLCMQFFGVEGGLLIKSQVFHGICDLNERNLKLRLKFSQQFFHVVVKVLLPKLCNMKKTVLHGRWSARHFNFRTSSLMQALCDFLRYRQGLPSTATAETKNHKCWSHLVKKRRF